MIKRVFLAIAAAAILVPAATSAQDLPAPEVGTEGQGGGVVYKKETEYDFEGDDVTGNLVKPNGENIGGELHGKTSSLIKIRSDFIPEMLKTVEEL